VRPNDDSISRLGTRAESERMSSPLVRSTSSSSALRVEIEIGTFWPITGHVEVRSETVAGRSTLP